MSDSSKGVKRSGFLRAAGLGVAVGALMENSVGAVARAAGGVGPTPAAETPQHAIELLKEGNARFVSGASHCGPLTARVVELEQGQSPFATILGCSDSRVPIETVFDQVPGHLFVVRVAGNFLTDDGLGSIEYGVAVLRTPAILVLGHTKCGAVDATVNFIKDGAAQPGHIQNLIVAIEPAAKAVKGKAGDWVHNAVVQNVKQNVAAMTARSSIVADAVKKGTVAVIGGVYDLGTGKVTIF
jgi:carbonic anhydrase